MLIILIEIIIESLNYINSTK